MSENIFYFTFLNRFHFAENSLKYVYRPLSSADQHHHFFRRRFHVVLKYLLSIPNYFQIEEKEILELSYFVLVIKLFKLNKKIRTFLSH